MKATVGVLTSWGPFGVFFLAILDSAGVPLPAAVDALLVATAAIKPEGAYVDALMAIAGSTIGSMILYYLGRKGGEAYLERATQTPRANALRIWFQSYGLITVFVPALLPIPLPLKVFVLCAGAFGVKPLTFLGVLLAARVPRYLGLAWLGSQLGHGTMGWLKANVWFLLAAAFVLALVLSLGVKVLTRESEKQLERR
ncbi:MAG TPA: VTT domain-containing protein [Bryobacteraceae bacterium]|nr:VTT domain-containing protein [Bryobacteraceae bacterium]